MPSLVVSLTTPPATSLSIETTPPTDQAGVSDTPLLTSELVSDGVRGLAAVARRILGLAAPTLSVYIHSSTGNRSIGGGTSDRRSIQTLAFDATTTEWMRQQLRALADTLGITLRFTESSSDSNLDIYLCADLNVNKTPALGVTLNNDNGKQAWSELLLNNALLNGNSEIFRFTFRHELGHVHGLEHPFDSSDGDSHGEAFGNPDGNQTLMSYTRPDGGWPDHYTAADWLALISIWGLNPNHTSGWLFSTQSGDEQIFSASTVLDRLSSLRPGDHFLGAAPGAANVAPKARQAAAVRVWPSNLSTGLTINASELFDDSDGPTGSETTLRLVELTTTLPGIRLESGALQIPAHSRIPQGSHTIRLTASDGISLSQPTEIDLIAIGITGLPQFNAVYTSQPFSSVRPTLNDGSGGIVDGVHWSLEGPDHDQFSVDSSSGVISLLPQALFDHPSSDATIHPNIRSVVLRATDANGDYATAPLSVEVKSLAQAIGPPAGGPPLLTFTELPDHSRVNVQVQWSGQPRLGVTAAVGFYRTNDIHGSLFDSTGKLLAPDHPDYAAAALSPTNLVGQLSNIQLASGNRDEITGSRNVSLAETHYIAPFATIDQTLITDAAMPTSPGVMARRVSTATLQPSQPRPPVPLGLTASTLLRSATVFAFPQANPGGGTYFQSLGDNTIALTTNLLSPHIHLHNAVIQFSMVHPGG